MKFKHLFLAAGLALTLTSAAIAGPITYAVNRTIGGGTVVGTIETDGTVGLLGGVNILNWALTLTSPNLIGGVDNISGTTEIIAGSSLTASLDDIVFDFSGSGLFGLQGSSFNAWCMATAGFACRSEATPSESIFFSPGFAGPAETTARTGSVVIATALDVGTVPEPASLALVGLALAGAGVARRRKRA